MLKSLMEKVEHRKDQMNYFIKEPKALKQQKIQMPQFFK